jgi:hypothetical protein
VLVREELTIEARAAEEPPDDIRPQKDKHDQDDVHLGRIAALLSPPVKMLPSAGKGMSARGTMWDTGVIIQLIASRWNAVEPLAWAAAYDESLRLLRSHPSQLMGYA